MKTKFIILLALSWTMLASAQTANSLVAQGTNDLVLQTQQGLWNANTNFASAVALSPANPTANVLWAATRLLVLPQTPAGSNFLNQLNITNGSRSVYGWTATLPSDLNGNPVFPVNYNSASLIAFFRTNIMAVIVGAATNLASVTNPNFTLPLSSAETASEDVTLDYGDIQMLRALLAAGQFAGYTLNANNCGVILPQVEAAMQTNGLTYQWLLSTYPNLLSLASASDLTASEGALTNAIALYFAASDYIRNVRVPGATGNLFSLSANDYPKEAQFRADLTNVLLSLTAPTEFDPSNLGSTVYGGAYFAGTHSLRSLMPKFLGDTYVNNTLPDYTFGGILPYQPAYKTESLLRKEFPTIAGIYYGQVDDMTFGDYYAGDFAVFISTNQQATVVGYDYDSAYYENNSQAGGVSAQFTIDAHGNWQFNSNKVSGVSGSGWVDKSGSFGGELDFTNGDSVEFDYGYELSAMGSFQNAAGNYTGTYSGKSQGQSISGTLSAVLSADGDLVFCVFQNGAQNDGGEGQLDSNNSFTTSSASGTTVSGTLTNATLKIGGSAVFTDGSVTFTMTRSANIPLDVPPAITLALTNQTVGVGSNATFRVTATGSAPLCYQWFCNGVPLPGATTNNLVVSNVSLAINGNQYAVIVQNVVGATNTAATLTVVDSVKPVVTNLNLTAGQSVSNGAFTVTGTAGDNSGVASVWYQLNNGIWMLASTTNNWTNWLATLNLVPGTNTLRIYAVDIASHGYVYVADFNNNLIRKITPADEVTTLAGDTYDLSNGNYFNWGYADGTNGAAMFYNPAGVATDGSGNVYVADIGNNLIRKITPAGVVTTLAGDTYDLTNYTGNAGYADGTNGAAMFCNPNGLAVDGSGNVYVADTYNNLIRKITPAGVVTTLAGDTYDLTNYTGNAGYADGTNGAAMFCNPNGLAVDGSGNVYVADTYNNLIRKITPAGVVTTLAGDTYDLTNYAGNYNGGYADGTNGAAMFHNPNGVAVDGFGNVYVADSGNNLIRKITPAGVVTTLAGDTYDLTNITGYYNAGYADGTNGAAMFYNPAGVATDGSGNVYVADSGNNLIRKITPAGLVTTPAGDTYDLTNYTGNAGYADGNGDAAMFYDPTGVALDDSGANISATNQVSFQFVVTN